MYSTKVKIVGINKVGGAILLHFASAGDWFAWELALLEDWPLYLKIGFAWGLALFRRDWLCLRTEESPCPW